MRNMKTVLDHCPDKRPVLMTFLGLLLALEIQFLDRPFQHGIPNMCINFSGGDTPVTQSTLDKVKVIGFFIEPSGERVPKRMNRIVLLDASSFQPQTKPELYLPCSDPRSSFGEEKRFVWFSRVAPEIGFHELFQRFTEEDNSLDPIFPIYPKDSLCEISMVSIECHQGSKSNAGCQKEAEHEVIPSGDRSLMGLESFKQCTNIKVGHGLRWSSRVTG